MAKKKKGFLAWLSGLFSSGKKPKRKKRSTKTPSKKSTAHQKNSKSKNKTIPQKKEVKEKKYTPKKRKNISQKIPNGRTLQTRDEYFEGRKDYRKPGYEDKGLYRQVVVVDSNRDDDLAVIQLTQSSKGVAISGREKSKFRPFVKTKDDDGNPIRIGEKFKEGKKSKDISTKAINEMKRLTFHNAGNAQENRDIVREMKGRNKKDTE